MLIFGPCSRHPRSATHSTEHAAAFVVRRCYDVSDARSGSRYTCISRGSTRGSIWIIYNKSWPRLNMIHFNPMIGRTLGTWYSNAGYVSIFLMDHLQVPTSRLAQSTRLWGGWSPSQLLCDEALRTSSRTSGPPWEFIPHPEYPAGYTCT
jgi:hypothetical protein